MKDLTVFANPNPKSFCHVRVWTRSKRAISIPSFKTVAQVQENIRAMAFGLLSNEQMKKIDETFERAGDLLGL